jgi:23S rRNA (adenine2030-N6)-methyltransferase
LRTPWSWSTPCSKKSSPFLVACAKLGAAGEIARSGAKDNMNYRHDFHAGNFADVFKHIFLTRVLLHLGLKPAAFRYIETHAGSGVYDLLGPQAAKTAEWRGGIGRLAAARWAPAAQDLIEPYLRIVAPLLDGAEPRYPGSPAIARALLRRQDKMLLCELHPDARRRLKANVGSSAQAKILDLDGYLGLKAFVPPVERRGLVLIDPPFEEAGEFERLAGAIAAAWRKWARGVYILWYPVKDGGQAASFAQALARSGVKPLLRLEFQIAACQPRGPLTRSGLMIVNPPFGLEAEARRILPCLGRSLAEGEPGALIEWIARE